MTTTSPIFAVTCRIPPGSEHQLRVEIVDRSVIAVGPAGFRHAIELPAGATTDRLEWRVYEDILEIRTPYVGMDEPGGWTPGAA